MAKITEGYMPFHGYQTYYRIVGEQKDNGKAPLICLHGGPGSTHNYFEVLDNVADDDDRMIIMYDQLGCGKSYLDGHPEMWTQDLWLDEQDALREHLGMDECHIIGQSWGGMMQIAYAIERGAKGVKLRPGMTLAIEPMINIGTYEVDWLDDDWTDHGHCG